MFLIQWIILIWGKPLVTCENCFPQFGSLAMAWKLSMTILESMVIIIPVFWISGDLPHNTTWVRTGVALWRFWVSLDAWVTLWMYNKMGIVVLIFSISFRISRNTIWVPTGRLLGALGLRWMLFEHSLDLNKDGNQDPHLWDIVWAPSQHHLGSHKDTFASAGNPQSVGLQSWNLLFVGSQSHTSPAKVHRFYSRPKVNCEQIVQTRDSVHRFLWAEV